MDILDPTAQILIAIVLIAALCTFAVALATSNDDSLFAPPPDHHKPTKD